MFAKMKYDVSKFKHTVDLVLANLAFFFWVLYLLPQKGGLDGGVLDGWKNL